MTTAPSPEKPSADVLAFRVRAAEVLFLFLAAQFIVPAISYIVAPALTLETMTQVNTLLGGGAWPSSEESQLWHMLAVGNVMTLGFMCALLGLDLARFYPALPSLAFLKGFSALYSLVLGFTEDIPGFFAVFALDGATTVAMVFFGVRARRAMRDLDDDPRGLPLLARLVLLRPRVVAENLARLAAHGRAPNGVTLFQIAQGCYRMWGRVMFRGDTVGTSSDPVRSTWRARALALRPIRFFFLVRERAIAPFDMSGLTSTRERIINHLLCAHHDGAQFVYDLELLSVHEGALAELRDRTREIVEHDTPRSRFLRDLCVYEGYHEKLLARVERALEGDLGADDAVASDPDVTLWAYLAWCQAQPRVA